MLIRVSGDPALRKRAAAWLIAEAITHTWLFQAVMIDDPADADRLRRWMEVQDREA